MKSKAWLLACLLPLLRSGAQLPELRFPAGVGVNIHFVTGHEADLDLIAAAGFKLVRMDFSWGATETSKGIYYWADYGQLLDDLDKRGLRALFILDYSNPLYEENVTSLDPLTHQPHHATASPQHPESIAAFARWAADAAKFFHGRRVIWEIWNEPNIGFWSPKPDADQYAALALATAKAVRKADPQATIIGPASSGFPWEFLETFLKSGVLEYLDAVSVHPYRGADKPPETAATDYEKLRKLIGKYAPANKRNIEILSGEWGYSSHRNGVSPEVQAAFAARQQLSNLLQGVPLSIWYDWKNDGDDPNENEHNFGTVLPDLTPKPAYVAIQTLTHELSGYRISMRLTLGSDRDYIVFCADAFGNQKVAAWTLGEPHTFELPIESPTAGKITARKSDGQTYSPKLASGRLLLDLTSSPQYVTLGKGKM